MDRNTTVGTMYVYKFNHMVDDKIYTRSIESYSTISQHPLKGIDGQRSIETRWVGSMDVAGLQSGIYYSGNC
ncbi:hypothetical protein [Candidatus Hodgkinia cicadicola]|uniref:hypothetical protein n=1 Tax=Candidatus Hodgkinia cicadicola TaxID=573658 RepID=UPI0011BAD509